MYSEDDSAILNRMKTNVPSDIDTSEGSFIHDALSPTAQEIAQQQINLDEILKKVFATTAAENGYSSELESRCEEQGIKRKQGTKAIGQVTFTGIAGTEVLKGTIVQTSGRLQYITINDAQIDDNNTNVIVDIQAIDIGIKYNIPAGAIIQIPVQVPGILSVTNASPTVGGTDIENNESMLQRYLIKVQEPSTGGNKYDYIKWALEVDGVGAVKVYPLWNGNGTVKVCIIDSNKQPAASDLVESVKKHIEELRPIGASITYESAEALNINIAVSIVSDSQYTKDQIKANVTNSIVTYLQNIAFKQNFLSYAKIGDAILNSQGIQDYSNLTINNNSSNIAIGDEQVAIIGTVLIS